MNAPAWESLTIAQRDRVVAKLWSLSQEAGFLAEARQLSGEPKQAAEARSDALAFAAAAMKLPIVLLRTVE